MGGGAKGAGRCGGSIPPPLDFGGEGPQGGEPWRRAAAGASSVALQLCMYEQT